jgi:short-chain fatty acids transporter
VAKESKADECRQTPIERMGHRMSENVEKWFPDPFLFAILLLFLVFILAWIIQGKNPYESAGFMYSGFWGFLAFAMQMCLILLLGYVIATHPSVGKLIKGLCTLPKNGKQAAALVALIACIFSWVNWGLGLVVGALMAREMGRNAYERGMAVHYPVLCAAGYTGLGLVWHWGLSGSAPLLSNVPGHFLEELIGLVPANETIFSSYGLLNTLLMIVFAMLICYLLHPGRPEPCRGLDQYAPAILKEEISVEAEKPEVFTFADKIENSQWIAIITVILGIAAMVWWFSTRGFMGGINLDSVNFIFIMVGLALYRNPIAYVRAIFRGSGAVGGIILQFPFYAGIQGVMTLSGLAITFADALARVATQFTYPFIALLIGGLVNLFIPSGGGEWMTIGEIVSRTSLAVNVPIGQTIMAYGAGDAWTNLFNPFWAIALLAITQVRARDMFGYCITIMLFATIPYFLGLTFIPY